MLTASYPPVVGGLQVVTKNLARGLKDKGHEVSVITNRYPRSLLRVEDAGGVKVRRILFMRPSWHYLRNLRIDLFLLAPFVDRHANREVLRLARELMPDVVNIHFPTDQIGVALELKHRLGLRLVVSLHGAEVERWADGPNESRGLALFRQLLREADAVTACSEWLLQRALAIEPDTKRAVSIPNGLNDRRGGEAKVNECASSYFLIVARLQKKKGIDLALDAFARVRDALPDVELWIAGGGPEEEALRQRAAKLGIAGLTRFLGPVPHDEVGALMYGALAVVAPSRSEPFGIVILEALRTRAALVATEVGGIPEIIERLANRMSCDARVPEGTRIKEYEALRTALVPPDANGLEAGLRLAYSRGWYEGLMSDDRGRVVAELFSNQRMVERYEEVLSG